MQESPKVLYIGAPSGTKPEAGHLAKSAGIARYAEARGWNVVPVAWARDLRRMMPAIIREERPAERADDARLRKWLASLPRRTALFCVNDNLAAAVVAAAAEAGLSVPRDVMVLGVDDRDASVPDPPLGISSVHVDFERGGYVAARTLDAVMHGTPPDPRDRCFGPFLTVRRRSTGGARRAEPNILEAIRIIRAEACQGLRAEDVVRRISGSRSLVDLRFREATGHSILDEILHVRLERACLLLAGTRTSIAAVATFCGFASENSLLKVFRARFGVPMRQWRKLHAHPSR